MSLYINVLFQDSRRMLPPCMFAFNTLDFKIGTRAFPRNPYIFHKQRWKDPGIGPQFDFAA